MRKATAGPTSIETLPMFELNAAADAVMAAPRGSASTGAQ